MKIVVHSGSKGFSGFSFCDCGGDSVLANLYLTWDEITERNLVPSDYNGGTFGCLSLPSRNDHLVLVSERLDNTRLVGLYCVCFKHGIARFGWYYCHSDDKNNINTPGRWDTPTGCDDLRSALLEAVAGHRRERGAGYA